MARRSEWVDPRTLGAKCDVCPLGPRAPFRQSEEHPWWGQSGEHPWAPVVGEGDSQQLVLAKCPGREDAYENRPMVGAFGLEVLRAVKQYPGGERASVSWDHVVACAVPGHDFNRFELRLNAHNRKRRRAGKDPLPSPVECCAPRLRRRLAITEAVIPMGKHAYTAVTGSQSGINNVRGTLAITDCMVEDSAGELRLRKIKVAPTVASFLHRRRWLSIMRLDVVRALAWFNGMLNWRDPKIVISRDPAFIKAWFERKAGTAAKPTPMIHDHETDGIYPRKLKLRCAGFGDVDEALVVPIHDLDGTPLWSAPHMRSVCKYLMGILRDERFAWGGHNAEYFDRLVLEYWSEGTLGERIAPKLTHDTIALASVIMPEHPKSLAFNATVHTSEGTPAWKADHTATTARDMRELAEYCGMDCVINARILPTMLEQMQVKKQERAYKALRGMQVVCAGFHRLGVPINQATQRKRLAETQELEAQSRAVCLDALEATGAPTTGYGKPKRKGDPCAFNPNSGDHLRDLLFVTWGLMPPAALSPKECFTKGGEYSVAKKILIALQYDAQVNEAQAHFIRKLLTFKRISKRRSTIAALGVRHWHNATYAGAIGASAVLSPGSYTNKKRSDGSVVAVPKYVGKTDPHSGKVHASWNAHGTGVSRVSCSQPNLLNVDPSIRDLVEAPPGYLFVDSDWSALHVRLIAAFWRIPRLVEACTPSKGYPDGKDAHALLCGMLFGDKFWKAEGHPDPSRLGAIGEYTGAAKRMRNPVKNYQYAMCYKASPATIYRVMASAMNDDGTRKFPEITQALIEGFADKVASTEPGWARNWARLEDTWKRQGYIEEPINGRRCWFEDGYIAQGIFTDDEDDEVIMGNVGNQIVNFEILGAEGSFASNVTLEFVDAVPFDYAGPGTGLIHQNYDSLLALVPEKDAQRVAGLMDEIMNKTINGIPMLAKAHIGKTWADVS